MMEMMEKRDGGVVITLLGLRWGVFDAPVLRTVLVLLVIV
jgi:hypothetical protein